MTSDARALDGLRLVLFAVLSGAFGVAVAEAFVQFSLRGDIGATAASLDDAFAWILGGCLGLFIVVIVFVPGLLFAVAGAAIGAASRRLLRAA